MFSHKSSKLVGFIKWVWLAILAVIFSFKVEKISSSALFKRPVWFFLIWFFFTSCVAVRVHLEPKYDQSTSFVHYSHYGFFGLIGKDSIDVRLACMDGKPIYVRNYFSFEDFLFAVTLLGLYTPKSTEVQCELSHHQEVFPLEL